MNEVEAVKTQDEIAAITTLLAKHGNQDYADIWKLGINVAFRITDLLYIQMTRIDINRRELTIIEGKTGKKRTVRLNTTACEVINRRIEAYPGDVYLFQSHGTKGVSTVKPLDRSTVARKFKLIGELLGINLGTHSMRKTRGYMMHQSGVSIEQICRVLNHSSPAVTMAYIGLTKEATLQTYDDFEL